MNNGKCWCKCKNKKKHLSVCNPSTYPSENGKYLRKMICDSVISVIMCDEIIKRTKTTSSKTFPLDFNEKGNLQNKL